MSDAFSVLGDPEAVRLPLLVHVPHGSLEVPPPWRQDIALSDDELRRELLAMTDHETATLFHQPPPTDGVVFVNRLSRLVFDPERFEDDAREPLSRLGMGAVYFRCQDGRPLRAATFSDDDREAVLAQLFRPYARALENTVDGLLQRFGRCLIIDGHSFPTRALPYEDPALARPQICLGFEDRHAPRALIAEIEALVRQRALSCSRNTPFAGSYVPLRHYGRDPRVTSLMIELRRDLYLDEQDGRRSDGFEPTRALVRAILELASRWLGA